MPTTQPSNNAVIIERLEGLSLILIEIKIALKEAQEQARLFQIDYERRHAILEAQAAAAHLRLDEHEKGLKSMEDAQTATAKIVAGLALQAKLINFIGAALGVSIIALIWGILTHQVALAF